MIHPFRYIQKRTVAQKILLGVVICALLIAPLVPIGMSGPKVAHAQGVIGQFLAAKFAPQILSGTLKSLVFPVVQGLSTIMMTVSAMYLGVSGVLLDYAVELTVVQMGALLDDMDSLDLAWELFRDAVNMIFIFVVLFIAISIILQLERYGQRKLLVSIIIAALLINFSMFFARVIVDASNVLTYQFYKPVEQLSGIAAATGDDPTRPGGVIGFASAFMDLMHLQTLYKELNSGHAALLGPLNTDLRVITFQMLGSVFILITAFVFTAAALFFVLRFVTIILLLVSSPLAFLGMILPKGENISNRWWGYLFETFWSVYFMLLISISYLILSDGSFIQHAFPTGNRSFVAAFANEGPGSMFVVLNFAIVIGFLIAALTIAKSSSANISRGFTNWATRFAGKATAGTLGWAGRQTFGRVGRRMADSSALNKMASSRNLPLRMLGSGLVRTGDRFHKSSFDVRAGVKNTAGVDLGKAQKGGRKKVEEAKTKRIQGYMDKGKGAVSDETLRLISKSERDLADAQRRKAQFGPNVKKYGKKYAEEEQAIWKDGRLNNLQKYGAVERLKQERRAAGQPVSVSKDRQAYEKASRDAEAAKQRLDAARAAAGVNQEKEDARRKLSIAAQNISPHEAGALREGIGKEKIAKESALEKQKAIAADASRPAAERQKAQQDVGRLENELNELNQGIDQLGAQQQRYLNTYVRYERAEMHQAATHKQNAQVIVEQNLGASNPATRSAAEKTRKKLNQGPNEKALKKIIDSMNEKDDDKGKDKKDDDNKDE